MELAGEWEMGIWVWRCQIRNGECGLRNAKWENYGNGSLMACSDVMGLHRMGFDGNENSL